MNYSDLEQKPKLIAEISLGFLIFSFLTGLLLGKVLEREQKEKFLRLKRERQVQEEKSLKEIFSKLPQERFLKMAAQ